MTKFSEQVIKIVKNIPKGRVLSYGQVALLAGNPRMARHVGWALHGSSDKETPWWRVINKSGCITIKHEQLTALDQKMLLESENVKVSKNFAVDIEKYGWEFSVKGGLEEI